MMAQGSKCSIRLSKIVQIALLICILLPVFSCFNYKTGRDDPQSSSNWGSDCDVFKAETSNVEEFARSIIIRGNTWITTKNLEDFTKELNGGHSPGSKIVTNTHVKPPFLPTPWKPDHEPTKEEREKHEENQKKYKEQLKKEKEDERKKKEEEEEKKKKMAETDPQYADGKSCIDGSDPPGTVSGRCDSVFDHKKLNNLVSKEFGKRCKNKVCNFHHLRGEDGAFVCKSNSIRATFLIIVTVVYIGFFLPEVIFV